MLHRAPGVEPAPEHARMIAGRLADAAIAKARATRNAMFRFWAGIAGDRDDADARGGMRATRSSSRSEALPC